MIRLNAAVYYQRKGNPLFHVYPTHALHARHLGSNDLKIRTVPSATPQILQDDGEDNGEDNFVQTNGFALSAGRNLPNGLLSLTSPEQILDPIKSIPVISVEEH